MSQSFVNAGVFIALAASAKRHSVMLGFRLAVGFVAGADATGQGQLGQPHALNKSGTVALSLPDRFEALRRNMRGNQARPNKSTGNRLPQTAGR